MKAGVIYWNGTRENVPGKFPYTAWSFFSFQREGETDPTRCLQERGTGAYQQADSYVIQRYGCGSVFPPLFDSVTLYGGRSRFTA